VSQIQKAEWTGCIGIIDGNIAHATNFSDLSTLQNSGHLEISSILEYDLGQRSDERSNFIEFLG